MTGSAIAIPLLGAAGAHAADGSTWDKVAECETGGSWSANPGSGVYGGLHLTQADWEAHGGLKYAARPDLASRSQQIAVAEKVLADQGVGHWPLCGPVSGLAQDSGSADVDTGVAGDATSGKASGSSGSSGSAGSAGSAGSGISSGSSGSHGLSDSPGSPDGSGDFGDSGASDGAGSAPAGSSGVAGSSASPGSASSSSGTSTGSPDSAPSGDVSSASPSLSPSSGGGSAAGDGSPAGAPSGVADPQGADGTSGATSGESEETGDPGNEGQSAGSSYLVDTGALGTGRHRGPRANEDAPGAGDVASVPDARGAGTDAAASGGRHAADGGDSYTVRAGDTLASIADSLGVDGGWRALYAANKDVVGADPGHILPGQTLHADA
ncbi:transglycosylase family protein [Streptomyces sp. MS06]|uniref:transglycosylase family protein n=1 Tax=Streptomyces sp. MS06 TaxID=3385974 RepID=UPI00399F3A79